jgi:hypothetical protein
MRERRGDADGRVLGGDGRVLQYMGDETLLWPLLAWAGGICSTPSGELVFGMLYGLVARVHLILLIFP